MLELQSSPLGGNLPRKCDNGEIRKLCRNLKLNYVNDDLNKPGFFIIL